MLRESDLDSLTSDLSSFSRDSQKQNDNLQDLLRSFKSLLEDYSALKSDYEEVKEGREKYKRQARGQDRNPFVLVLIDGDGYHFKEHFLRAGSEGGINAARELSDSIKELMHSTMGLQADQCRIMVRVYANILGLSKVLARMGLVGHEARSLSSFTAAFNRAEDLFDFVDAAEKKEGSDFKIRELFRLFVDLNQCRHIYFAGCHDTGFGSLLTPYRGRGERITLLKAASFHRDFESLNLPIKELPSVFMSTPLNTSVPNIPKQVLPINTKAANASTNGARVVCKHYQKGICRYGNGCIKQHIMPNQELTAKSGEDSPTKLWSVPPILGRSLEYLSATLPHPGLQSENSIPINKDGERLDLFCPHPSSEAMDRYHRRAKEHKVCNSYHLSGECGDMSCQYDHSDVSDTIIEVLRYILLQHPCPRATTCRSIKCYMGHLCQKPNCKAVKSWQCRFNHRAHTMDLKLSQWVPPVEQIDGEQSSISGDSYDRESSSPGVFF
ncbi:Zinc finger CCCH-type [Penicillium capsulatum]|uniref:Zinc finger CCCH-type n=1 Tax=Penicillium capsulatum TaxID=69766 RepID=A0A9W9IPB3_9EURO|nr:Zinc finger CCCH-type [Penicillium capsulatum]KAJ6121621.1 Zinc finger CCCH-type [Penicillium capsulatum]